MKLDFEKDGLAWLSTLLRLIFSSLFLGAGLIKVQGGISGSIEYYVSLFKDSILPLTLVKAHASTIMFAEFGLAVWLISGYRLKAAWIGSAILLLTLAFGMIFTYQFDVVAHNYLYVVLAGMGILLTPYDRFQWPSKQVGP